MPATHPPLPFPVALPSREHDLRLFDGLAPFFHGHPGEPTNWSKIPFARLEADGMLEPAGRETLILSWDAYLAAMSGLGYNAVAVDDLAHLVAWPWYPQELQHLLARYRALYEQLFARARARGLGVFVVTDYCFFNQAIEEHLTESGQTPLDFFAATVDAALRQHPTIDGLVLRIGESDGVDVQDAFTSRLTIGRTGEARELLERLLPTLEARGKTLIFRTWTLGAGEIGDLMWNLRAYDAVFGGVTSPALIVSLKYGDADFFRYLPLNPLFFHGEQRKLVELQCRREYEGMGEYPAFTGWLYAGYINQLRAGGANLAGCFALQAGGWSPWSKLAFTGEGNVWTELNAFTTLRSWLGEDVETGVRYFCAWRGIADADRFLAFLTLADRAILDGLYIRGFAERQLYFRRVRIPPLIWVFWRDVTAGGLIARLHRLLVPDPAAAVAQGQHAVACIEAMIGIAIELGLPVEDLEFQLDSFRLLALLRSVLLGVGEAAARRRLQELLPAYHDRYPLGYRIDFAPTPLDRYERPVGWLLRLLLRQQMDYRRLDRVLLNQQVSRGKRWLLQRLASGLPGFVGKQGMSAERLLH